MDITYYLLQDWNHWCSTSFTYCLVGPQALLSCDYTTGKLLHPLGAVCPTTPTKCISQSCHLKKSEWLNPSKLLPLACTDPSLCPAVERIRTQVPSIFAAHRGSEKQGRAEALSKWQKKLRQPHTETHNKEAGRSS